MNFNREHLHLGDRLCAAVSGGADSVALLRALHAANAAPRNALGVGLSVVHVHHNLRGPAADADAAFVQHLCQTLEIPLHLHHVDTPAHILHSGETTEEAARTLRYQVFRTLLNEGHADAILTAHTLDDQSETVLMKLLRGAWTEGLSAIHPVLTIPKGRILRPLLSTRRAEVEFYLNHLQQPWCEDLTNADPAHTRNRIRHTILPLLRAENPSLDQTLANLAELAREEEIHWQADLNRLLPQLLLPGKPVRGGGRSVSTAPGTASFAIEIERLRPLDAATRRRILRAAARKLNVRLSFDETARLLALCGFHTDPTVPSRPNTTLKLAHNLTAHRSNREITLSIA